MLIVWFLKQRRADKIAVCLAVLVMTPVLWTALASVLFVALKGAGMREQHPFTDPYTYWLWLDYFSYADQPLNTVRLLMVSGVVAAFPFAALIVRQGIDYVSGRAGRPVLYGASAWASQEDEQRGNVRTTKEIF
jgi:hypothetical protein